MLHRDALREHGGADGIRDGAMLLSAIAQPQATFGGAWLHPRLVDMAAAYAFHIAENQPFIDGNKRTALRSALVFLARHDVRVVDPTRKLLDAMLGLADHSVTKASLAELFAELCGQHPAAVQQRNVVEHPLVHVHDGHLKIGR
ncbi:MAG: Fic family protein [Polyangiaceae bacterium]|nr:Fic family protein [Polyangiaceae bacterium]